MLRFFAHVVDNHRSIVLILSGSEIGVLFDFLGFEKPGSPLYGRYFTRLHMENFAEQMSKEFLSKCFEQMGLHPPQSVIEYAVQRLDGNPGWLTLFGARCREAHECKRETVDEVAVEGDRLVRAEVERIVALSGRYGSILNLVAKIGSATWSQLKAAVEAREARSITNSSISNLIKNLLDLGTISAQNGKYYITDPVLAEAIRKEMLSE